MFGRSTGISIFRKRRQRGGLATDYDRGVLASQLLLAQAHDPVLALRHLSAVKGPDDRHETPSLVKAIAEVVVGAERRKHIGLRAAPLENLKLRVEKIDSPVQAEFVQCIDEEAPALGRKAEEALGEYLSLGVAALETNDRRYGYWVDLEVSVGAVPTAYQAPLIMERQRPVAGSEAFLRIEREVALLAFLGPKTLVDTVFNVEYSGDPHRSRETYERVMRSLQNRLETTGIEVQAPDEGDVKLGWLPGPMRPVAASVRQLNSMMVSCGRHFGGSACAVLDALDLPVCPTKDHHVIKLSETSVA